MWDKPKGPESKTRRVDFDFTFSKEERIKKRITLKELDALLKYDGIDTRKVTAKNFVKTLVEVTAPEGSPEPLVTVEMELLQRLTGKIAEKQYDTLKQLLGK